LEDVTLHNEQHAVAGKKHCCSQEDFAASAPWAV